MGAFLSAIKKYYGFVWLPLWSGLLLLPLAGMGDAVRIAAVAALCVLLWRLAKTKTLANFNKAVFKRLPPLPFTYLPLLNPRPVLSPRSFSSSCCPFS